jgi:flagellar biosynthetic protein FliR
VIEESVIWFSLLLARTTAFWFVVPLFGGRQSPHSVKIGLSVALCLFWMYSSAAPSPEVQRLVRADAFVLAVATAREVLIGLGLGLAFEALIVPAKIAGAYLAQELGLNLASMTDPTTQSSSDVMANVMQSIALLAFLSLNLHHFMIVALDEAVRRIPVCGKFPWPLFQAEASGMAAAVPLGLQIVAPLAVALIVVLAGLLILTRAVPALNLFSVGLSARLLVGLGLLLLLLPSVIHNVVLSLERGRLAIAHWIEWSSS